MEMMFDVDMLDDIRGARPAAAAASEASEAEDVDAPHVVVWPQMFWLHGGWHMDG